MHERTELHEIFCEIINITDSDGDRHVYFQPPASVKIKYPAIVYSRKNLSHVYASNGAYMRWQGYEVTVIDKNPDSEYVEAVSKLPYCSFDRHFKSDNLNHDVFTIY